MIFQRIRNKRHFLARSFEQLGLLHMLEQAAATRGPAVTALTYHRIAEPSANAFYDPVISATPAAFHSHIEWLSNHVRLLTLDDLIGRLESRTPWHEPAVMLTFDDGYRDNVEVAVPILHKYHAPATFFIATAFLESPQLPWWDHIAYVLKRTRVTNLTLARSPDDRASPLVIDLAETSRPVAITTVVRAFLDGTILNERWFLEQLGRIAHVDLDERDLGRALFMTWDHLRQLADPARGLAVGSHTHSHQKLTRLAESLQRRELSSSKQILETHLGCEIKALAYPYGWHGTYTACTKSLAAETGYRLAFTSHERPNRRTTLDPYEISRIGISTGDSQALVRARIALHGTVGRSFL
jgi:peptidoglycan/xylan/chitin deacetylase (PgdA/CDA1 family)